MNNGAPSISAGALSDPSLTTVRSLARYSAYSHQPNRTASVQDSIYRQHTQSFMNPSHFAIIPTGWLAC